uniref:Ig-like domain-containing protein n=1 Tax=Ditylenchus dipsaci TaxID=166011 RepID=A0A915EQE2_9BILA
MLTRKKFAASIFVKCFLTTFCRVRPLLFLILPVTLSLFLPNAADAAVYAQGNLALVFEAQSGKTSETLPLHDNLTALWCQATENGQDKLPIKSSKFLQVNPPPTRMHKGDVVENRAHLRFGRVTPSAVGKYKCEITTESGDFVTGNLFVYMRPVIYNNGSLKLDQAEEGKPFHLVNTGLSKVVRGEIARLTCPAIGYPIPSIRWFRDGEPIGISEKFVQLGNQLHIKEVDDPDEGIYNCDFEVKLDQHLRVTSSLSWLIPLIVIFVILILLFLTIYLCAAWKRYKHAQYNVAQKEKCLRKAEEQQLHEDEDE